MASLKMRNISKSIRPSDLYELIFKQLDTQLLGDFGGIKCCLLKEA